MYEKSNYLKQSAETLLTQYLLCSVENNYSHLINSREMEHQPAWLERMDQFLAANVRMALGVEDIADAVGVSVRSLYDYLGDHRQTSPIAYFKKCGLSMHDMN